jgi:hypothetical protein
MISCQSLGLNGRFGNQMFQYATLYALGKELKYDIGVPYQTKSPNDKLNFCLPECFNLSAKDSSSHFFGSVYLEVAFQYNSDIKKISDNTDIRGYFQTEKYFKSYESDLKTKEFKFLPFIEEKANFLLKTDKEYVAIHMRLGDYLYLQDCHPICSAEYYKTALGSIPDNAEIILFSDDLKQAASIIKDCGRKINLFGTNDKFIDMCVMTKCNYHIIANSSFSWWGAWLSNSKKVIAPKKWFGTSNTVPKNWDDIYCNGWIII